MTNKIRPMAVFSFLLKRIDFVTWKGSGSWKEDLADTVTLVVSILQEH
jgi:hypothetical protein